MYVSDTYLNQSEFHNGLRLFLYTSVLKVVSPSLTSAKASVVSEDRSMTGRFLPATTFTRTFPGIIRGQRQRLTVNQEHLCFERLFRSFSPAALISRLSAMPSLSVLLSALRSALT